MTCEGAVLGDDLVVVEHLKLLGSVTADEVEQGLGSTGMLVQPVGAGPERRP